MDELEKTIIKFKRFQELILDNDASQNDIYLESESLINDLHGCSKSIENKFSDISKKLTDHMNTGRWQS